MGSTGNSNAAHLYLLVLPARVLCRVTLFILGKTFWRFQRLGNGHVTHPHVASLVAHRRKGNNRYGANRKTCGSRMPTLCNGNDQDDDASKSEQLFDGSRSKSCLLV